MASSAAAAAAAALDEAWNALVAEAYEKEPEQPPPLGTVCLEVLPESVAQLVLRLGVPECVRAAAVGGQFCSVVQEPGSAIAWVPRSLLPKASKLADRDGAEEAEPGVAWCVVRFGCPGSSGGGVKVPALPGMAAQLCDELSEVLANIRLSSAFGGMDALLIPEDSLAAATRELVRRGHAIWPASRLVEPVPWKALRAPPASASLARKVAGAWALTRREEPHGTVVAEHADAQGPIRLQASGGLFVEIRIPEEQARAGGMEQREASFCGTCRAVQKDGRIVCSHLCAADFQPPAVDVARSLVTLNRSSMDVVGHPEPLFRERWRRCGDPRLTDVVALELQSESPEPKHPRCGIWVFVGGRWARMVGPPRGSGLVAGTCCRSLAHLQALRGAQEVKHELRKHYHAVLGVLEEPGLLRIEREAMRPERRGAVFYNALDEATGEIVTSEDTVLRVLPGGQRETWRIVEWTFDPFAPSDGADDAAKPRRRYGGGSSRSPSAQPAKRRRAALLKPRAGASQGEEEDEGEEWGGDWRSGGGQDRRGRDWGGGGDATPELKPRSPRRGGGWSHGGRHTARDDSDDDVVEVTAPAAAPQAAPERLPRRGLLGAALRGVGAQTADGGAPGVRRRPA